jgi:subtilisin family serine protease
VYVLDTGIRLTHVDFEGRASFGYNAVGGTNEPLIEHGTSIASFAVGKTYGVAKKAHVIDVNVFGDSSATSDSIILDGFNWAVDDIIANNRVNVSVINMSLGGARTANSPWDAAIQNAFDLGILVVVAAGNENLNASTRSPASSPAALTVGNIDKTNVRNNESPSFGSNYGPAVKIFAPGTAVTGASLQSDTAVIDTTGTSDASPHVAGLACYLRGLYGPSSAKDITQQILELATKDVVVDPKGSANLLAYNGSGR